MWQVDVFVNKMYNKGHQKSKSLSLSLSFFCPHKEKGENEPEGAPKSKA